MEGIATVKEKDGVIWTRIKMMRKFMILLSVLKVWANRIGYWAGFSCERKNGDQAHLSNFSLSDFAVLG